MPDWFYRTVSRPMLYQVPAATARDFALGFMGTLARLPLGPNAIDFMGHMRADDRLAEHHQGVTFPTSIGLGPWLDRNALALPALARFGIGFIEIGPVGIDPHTPPDPVSRDDTDESFRFTEPLAQPGLQALLPHITDSSKLGIPLIVHLDLPGTTAAADHDAASFLLDAVRDHATFVSIPVPEWAVDDTAWEDFLQTLFENLYGESAAENEATESNRVRLLLRLPADANFDQRTACIKPCIEASRAGLVGVVVDGSLRIDGVTAAGGPAREPALNLVRQLRALLGNDALIIAGGGVHEPAHALEFRQAGANLVSLDTGLVFTGPGLPKRCNEALLFEKIQRANGETPPEAGRPGEMSWFWIALMGAGMFGGSIMALIIAATRVVLPYDEKFVGMDRHQLHQVNDRLLAFMSHDRVSLAGAMVAIGAIYLGLAVFAIRRGFHWAQLAVFLSAFTGFASFFLFLGFGYLDPFHAFVTAVLFQLLLLGVHCKLGTYKPVVPPELVGDRAWLMSLWGQLLLILHAAGLLGAGVVISTIGITHVFVPEDLEFMRTSASTLTHANPHLVPLVAHDRATLGGMLLANGWLFLLFPMWGFRRGSRGLWWTYLCAGVAAYTSAIGVHYLVGYIDLGHLLPAYAGLAVLVTGLGLSYAHLCRS